MHKYIIRLCWHSLVAYTVGSLASKGGEGGYNTLGWDMDL